MGAFSLFRDAERTSHRVIAYASFHFILLVSLLLWIGSAGRAFTQCVGCAQYGPTRVWTTNTDSAITDASGLAASAKNPGIVWTHNDSGNSDGLLYGLTTNGVLRAAFSLGTDAIADLEDMAIGPGPVAGTPYLYVGDIGVGGLAVLTRPSVRIYRAPEPDVLSTFDGQIRPLPQVETFTLFYPDGGFDADTMMVDPLTGDIFVGAKQTGATRIYRASLAGATNGASIRLELAATTTLSGASGGTISADGSRVVLRNERNARLWFRCPGETIGVAMAKSPEAIPLAGTGFETNGEAIAFMPDGNGYITIGDSVLSPPLFFFPLNCTSNGVPPTTNGPPATPLPPPVTTIVTQPQGGIVEPGGTFQLSVVATGQNLKYQWRFNDSLIPGATGSTLTLTDIQPTQTGLYSVIVVGDNGTLLSQAAGVAVRSSSLEPVILIPPQSMNVVRGGWARLIVLASGEEPLSYSWTRDGRSLPTSGPVLTLRNAKKSDSGFYHVTVSNARGVAEAEAEVQVLQGPTVRVSGRKVVRAGSTVVLRAVARGAEPLEFQWLVNNQEIPGETGSTLVLNGVDGNSAGLYVVRVANPVGIAAAGVNLRVR